MCVCDDYYYRSNKLLYGIGNKVPIGIVQKLQVIFVVEGAHVCIAGGLKDTQLREG